MKEKQKKRENKAASLRAPSRAAVSLEGCLLLSTALFTLPCSRALLTPPRSAAAAALDELSFFIYFSAPLVSTRCGGTYERLAPPLFRCILSLQLYSTTLLCSAIIPFPDSSPGRLGEIDPRTRPGCTAGASSSRPATLSINGRGR